MSSSRDSLAAKERPRPLSEGELDELKKRKDFMRAGDYDKRRDEIVIEIARVPDAAQRLTLAERFQKSFTNEAELERIRPVLIDSYARGKRVCG